MKDIFNLAKELATGLSMLVVCLVGIALALLVLRVFLVIVLALLGIPEG